LADARHQLAREKLPQDGHITAPVFVDIRKCLVAITAWKEREIGRESVRLYGRPKGLTDDRAWEGCEEGRRDLREKLTQPDGYKAISGFDEKLREAMGETVIHIPADHVVMNVLRPTFRDAWAEVFTVIDGVVAAIRGNTLPADDPAEPINQRSAATAVPSYAEQPMPGQSNLRLSELADAYVAECGADPDYGEDVKTYARRLGESLGGDVLVRQITKRDMMTFKDRIAKVPARPSHAQRRLPLLDLIAVTERQNSSTAVRSRPCLSAKTVKKWLDYLGAMFRFGIANDHCMLNPAEGIKRPRLKNVEPTRQHFEHDELRMIFTSPLYRGHDGGPYRCTPGDEIMKDSKYWLPLLALYTGCRRNEMAQARAADVKSEDGIDFLHITTLADDGGRKKKVKTAGSRRKVPLHRALIDAGFVEYAAGLRQRGEIYLFPDIDHTAKEPAGSFGKWFDRFCERLAKSHGQSPKTGIDASSRTFHSFRHTFKRACRDAEISKDVHDELTGHSGGADVGSGYGRTGDGRFSLTVLNNAIQRVRYSNLMPPEPEVPWHFGSVDGQGPREAS
jgi:integrase